MNPLTQYAATSVIAIPLEQLAFKSGMIVLAGVTAKIIKKFDPNAPMTPAQAATFAIGSFIAQFAFENTVGKHSSLQMIEFLTCLLGGNILTQHLWESISLLEQFSLTCWE